MESWLQDNYIEVYSTNNEWKSVVAERLFGTFKDRTTYFLTSLLRKAYTNKSNNIVNGYNNIYDMTIKMKSVDVKPSTYIDLGLKYTEEDPTFEVKHHVRTKKKKKVFGKWYTQNWLEEGFVIKKMKNTVPWIYLIERLNEQEVTRTFYQK